MVVPFGSTRYELAQDNRLETDETEGRARMVRVLD